MTAQPLHVGADLSFEVDGVRGHLTGAGSTLRVTTERPVALWVGTARTGRAAGRPVSLRVVRLAIGQLREHGLTVHIDGPLGSTLQIGDHPGLRLGARVWCVAASTGVLVVAAMIGRRRR